MKKIIFFLLFAPLFLGAQLQNGTTIPNVTSATVPTIQALSNGTSDTLAVNQASGNGVVVKVYVIDNKAFYIRTSVGYPWISQTTTSSGVIQHDTVSLQINSVTFTPTPSVDFTAIDNTKIELYALSALDLEVHRIFFNGETNAGASVTSKTSTSMVFNVATLVSGLTTPQKQSILYKLIVHK